MIDNKINEILEQIRSNQGAAFGLLYPYVLVIILAMGLYYLGTMGSVVQQKIPPLISEVPEVVDLTVQQPRSIPPVDVKLISNSTSELIEKGRGIYQVTCAGCHGEEGAGAGPASVGLNPAPRNFTKHEGWKNGETISGMYTTLQEGIPNGSMIAYDFLTPEEKFGLIHYMRTAFITDPPVDTDSELEALDKIYNLSAGTEVPGQIPTEFAGQLIVDENFDKIEKVRITNEHILLNQIDHSARLLINVADDLQIALSTLVNSDKWRSNKNAMMNFLTSNVNQNGFNGRIFILNQEEWSSLYNYLNNIL